ncbi:hypothetical protein E1295_43290 [Nonomuraea mesophila]|uniref:ABC transporter ATP-binding protein n=1 Tax=Nonomuraea mesophila TaxID=2530382 RepID=A0A4R5E855_9ACTN|nr:hypothetical protein [Nonomuraea mesophila]TDE27325.1 hypothetical protein E1295_43290 [Nonomuraea mesophila]
MPHPPYRAQEQAGARLRRADLGPRHRAEIEVFDKVAALAERERTVILITHRLTSVTRAGGTYAAMYRLQAAQYAKEEQPTRRP